MLDQRGSDGYQVRRKVSEHLSKVRMTKRLRILGTRGIPANHGGFETFAEHLALYLVGRGWEVTVYCQVQAGAGFHESHWQGVHLVRIPVKQQGALGTIVFDWKSSVHAARSPGLVLTLGYNTAVFCALFRSKGINNLINMDGIEWRRQKWGPVAKAWFWFNSWVGCWFGNHLIADHPEIAKYLEARVRAGKITTIPYGAHEVLDADPTHLVDYGLIPRGYAILIARAEPENSILEVVRAWSRKQRGIKLVVLGQYDSRHSYQRKVMEAASAEVIFPGAIYEKPVVESLRFFSLLYLHGHQVGGTNPSLVEALGAGSPVLAHNNRFNRWVAGEGALYFSNEDECDARLDAILQDETTLATMRQASLDKHGVEYTWGRVLSDYERLLLDFV